MMSVMNETAEPRPGVVYRIQGNCQGNLSVYESASVKFDRKYNNSDINKVIIKRRSGFIYVNFNDSTDEKIIDMSSLPTPFDSPLVFGCSLDGSGNPQRFLTGT